MGYGNDGLKFNALREANKARLPEFKNSKGEYAHSKPDGSDWTPAQWLQAVVGELGEYANKRKKFERGDLTLEEFKLQAGKELADVQTYLDILAQRCLDTVDAAHPYGIDLGQVTIDKFNEISIRVGSSVRLAADDWHRARPGNMGRPSEVIKSAGVEASQWNFQDMGMPCFECGEYGKHAPDCAARGGK